MKKLTSIILVVMLFFSTLIISCGNKESNTVNEKESSELKEVDVPENFVLRTVVELEDNEIEAGTAFAAKSENETVIITAIHIFGPAGGLEEYIPAKELGNRVKMVKLTDAFTGMDCGMSSKILDIPDAKPTPEVDKDVVAFMAGKDTKVSALNISSDMPKVGEDVWLVASVFDGPEIEKKLHKGTVVESSKTTLAFEYENSNLVIDATSGAPILNSRGEIVGINVGGIEEKDKLIGVANPSYSFKKMISDALKK